jgi:hypothetical protein
LAARQKSVYLKMKHTHFQPNRAKNLINAGTK